VASTEENELTQLQLASAEKEARAKGKPAAFARDGSKFVEFDGVEYRLADEIGIIPLMRWAAAADLSTDDSGAMGAMWAILQDMVDAPEFPAWVKHATRIKSDAEEVLDFVNVCMEAITGNPTERPGSSSDTPPSTSAESTENSSVSTVKASPRSRRAKSAT
jgi:hypothetical protein